MRIVTLEKRLLEDFIQIREELYSEFVTRQDLVAQMNRTLRERGHISSEQTADGSSTAPKEPEQTREALKQIETAVERLENNTMASIIAVKRGIGREKVFRRDLQNQIKDLQEKFVSESVLSSDILETIGHELSSIRELLSEINASTRERDTSPTFPETFEVKRDCLEWLNAGHVTNGVYRIHPIGVSVPVHVYCDMETDGGGWTVFQMRCDGSVDFVRDWMDYRFGFGHLTGEFWLGNELIHRLTSQWPCELRIDLEDFENETRYETHRLFSVGSEEERFKLHIEGGDGTAGNCFSYHSDAGFSTIDNDATHKNFCQRYKGGF